MREIKFRGRDICTGEWLYGDLRQRAGCFPSIIRPFYNNGKLDYCETPIHRDSLGQFTGLYDVNDKEIYEGDIVDWGFTYQHICYSGGVEFRDTIVKGIIKWQQGGFILEVIENDFENAGMYGISDLETDTESDVEIIGNIHDNAELLKGGNDEND